MKTTLRESIANFFLTRQHPGLRELNRELFSTEYYNENEIREYQNRKLLLLVKHCYENVPYYKTLFDNHGINPLDIRSAEDLIRIPVLEKESIQNNAKLLLATNNKFIYNRSTSGSTGHPLNVIYDRNSKLMEIALMQRFSKSIGKSLGMNEINLWGRIDTAFKARLYRFIKSKIFNIDYKNIYGFRDQDYLNIIKELDKNQHVLLRGFTHSVYMIACKLKEQNRTLNVDAVVVTAEKLLNAQRALINRHLSKNLYDQYGCGEVNAIAFECCHHNGLHHAFEHSILEISGRNGCQENVSGEVIITNLDNYAMPLLRYRNGDLVQLKTNDCKCGRQGLLIKSIEGRLYDFIEGPNGVKIHSAFLDHILVDSELLETYNVSEIRIVQTEINTLVLQYVSKNDIPEKSFESFRKKINEYMGEMQIRFIRKNHIKETINGKRRFVIPLAEFLKDPFIL